MVPSFSLTKINRTQAPFRRPVFSLAVLVIGLLLSFGATAQTKQTKGVWSPANERELTVKGKRVITPEVYRVFKLDAAALKSVLALAPMEFANAPAPVLPLPLPDGGFMNFRIEVSPMMEKGLADQFPEIQTYRIVGMENAGIVGKVDFSPYGFHAMFFMPDNQVFIDPYSTQETENYIVYNKKDYKQSAAGKTFTETEPVVYEPEYHQQVQQFMTTPAFTEAKVANGTQLRTYRLAVATTVEYSAYHGTTKPQVLAAIVTTMNRVNGVYEKDLSIRMNLVANNSNIIYLGASNSDPYTNGNGGTMLGENQTNIDNVIGNANYDIGHVFSTGGGGVAGLGVVCRTGNKARGVTGQANPIGDPFDIDYVAHEMGHQFGANHTFNGNTGSCTSNRVASCAYEPGSGVTVMAYAGICAPQNIAPNSIDIFHTKSFDEIIAYSVSGSGNGCAVKVTTGNVVPVPTVPAGGWVIPRNTPFKLVGSATDGNASDVLSYCWEQYDLGAAGAPNSPSGTAPIFRDFVPKANGERVFPQWSDIVNNTQTLGEILPSYTRNLNFRMTVRDNQGGSDYRLVSFSANGASGPFTVSNPNTAITWSGLSTQTVTWVVANTSTAPVNCQTVNIKLSTDGGFTYPYTLLSGTPNDGSQAITVPNVNTTTARVMVEAADNIFFDISNVNFTINATAANQAPLIANQSFSVAENSAVGVAVGTVAASDPDGGQTLTYAITAGNTGGTFAIDPATGAITVANNTLLDFETNPTFTLTVQVTDNGASPLSASATVTINVTDVFENSAPVIADQNFSVVENSANGTAVGTVAASDPDGGQTLTYAITAGNTGGTFAIDPATGAITVANNTLLDFETNPTFTLTVQVTDNGASPLSASATVTINVTDVFENSAPVIADQNFSVAENSANGTAVGTVAASDPDGGQTLTYAITAGNTGGTFAIDPATGAITVANNTLLDFETNPTFTLTVQVTDNGASPLSASATVTINVTDVFEGVTNPVAFSVAPGGVSADLILWLKAEDFDNTVWENVAAGNQVGNATAQLDPSTGTIIGGYSAPLRVDGQINGRPVVRFNGSQLLTLPQGTQLNNSRFYEKTAMAVFRPDAAAYPNGSVSRSVIYEQGARDGGLNFWTSIDKTGAEAKIGVNGAAHNARKGIFKPFAFSNAGTDELVVTSLNLKAPNYTAASISFQTPVALHDVYGQNANPAATSPALNVGSFLPAHNGFVGIGSIHGAVRYGATNSFPDVQPVTGPLASTVQNMSDLDPFRGDMAEILQWNRSLNQSETFVVRNYLAAKYGYVLPNDAVAGEIGGDIYPQNDQDGYSFDVSGVMRVSATDAKTESKSDPFVKIVAPTVGAGEALLWGHNNADIAAANTTDVPTGIDNRFNLVWSAVSTDLNGEDGVGDVSLYFDVSAFPAVNAGNYTDLRLLARDYACAGFVGGACAAAAQLSPAAYDGTNNWVRFDFNPAAVQTLAVVSAGRSEARFRFTLASANPALSLKGQSGLRQVQRQNPTAMQAVVYPNPTRGETSLLVQGQLAENVSVTVIDLLGKTHLQTQIETDGQTAHSSLNLSDLPAGVYVVRVINGAEVRQMRVVKE